MKTLGIETEAIGADAWVLKLTGTLDSDTRAALTAKLDSLLQQQGLASISVDMSKVEYMASAGAGAILKAMLSAKDKGVRLTFLNLHPRVQYIFRVMGLPMDSSQMT